MPTEPPPARAWTPAALRDVAMGFQQSRVLLTAVELRVFSAIGEQGLTSEELAARLSTQPRATDRLLNALCAMRLLVKRERRYWNTADSRRYLDDRSPDFAAGLGHTASMWHSWSGLTDAVREGRPALRAPINDRGDSWLEPFIAAMHYRALQQAPAIAALLDLAGVRRVLDVGGGSGAFAMEFARQQPQLRATVFDLPSVVPLTRSYLAAAGLEAQVATAAGDYLRDPMPAGFDLAFLSAVVHSNAPGENARLVRACAEAVVPGGRVAIVDWVMDEDRVQPPAGAFFALNMLVATDHGDTFTEAEIRSWMDAAGLARGPRLETGAGTSIILGLRTARR